MLLLLDVWYLGGQLLGSSVLHTVLWQALVTPFTYLSISPSGRWAPESPSCLFLPSPQGTVGLQGGLPKGWGREEHTVGQLEADGSELPGWMVPVVRAPVLPHKCIQGVGDGISELQLSGGELRKADFCLQMKCAHHQEQRGFAFLILGRVRNRYWRIELGLTKSWPLGKCALMDFLIII